MAVATVPFLDLVDQEEAALAEQVSEAADAHAVAAAMEASRRRLAQGVDGVVRGLPAAVRGDLAASRAVAYALVGLVDGRMLHHPAGGLERWRERLLESDLYGSALAGQEVVSRARASAHGLSEGSTGIAGEGSTFAPFYLAVFRAGFEGSLRGDAVGLASLVAALEEAVGVRGETPLDVAVDQRPKRLGLAPLPLGALGVATWLAASFAVWLALSSGTLTETERIAGRISAGLPATSVADPLERSIGPSGLTAPDADGADER